MKIGIEINNKSYLPEAFAYQKFLLDNGYQVQLAPADDLSTLNDINLFFMGLRNKKTKTPEIHEYHSLSIPPLSKTKDFLKARLNSKPSGRIFLNQKVKDHLNFQDEIKFIYRDMGVDDIFFHQKKNTKEFDIVYAGSIDSRPNILNIFENLSKKGFKQCIIGKISDNTNKFLKGFNNITLTGPLKRTEIPYIYSISEAGLNYTPDIYPFNIQTSTKTLEYLSSGIKCISNRYQWSIDFSNEIGYDFLWLEEMNSPSDLYNSSSPNLNMEFFKWENILIRSQFINFLLNQASI